ncbi:MAG: fatty acid desaturase [Rhizomicrobium sp.]
MAQDVAVMTILYLAILGFAGWRGAALFLAQSAVGIVVLELFNYIAHYGLAARPRPSGHEPFGDRHSWNSSNVLANTLIFNMGRHSYHHTRPPRPIRASNGSRRRPNCPPATPAASCWP